MSKRTTFTNISPLPSSMTREQALTFLHDHLEMIDLNPLVIERHRIDTPAHALDGEKHCTWYSITDKIEYIPGGAVKSDVTYTCAFHDMPDGLQTHCYAPMGTDIRDRWTVAGTLPGEPPQPVELGLDAPKTGLYLREDVELKCNFLMSSFVKKTLSKSHGKLVDTMIGRAKSMPPSASNSTTNTAASTPSTQTSQLYSHHTSSLSSGINGIYRPPTLGSQHQSQQWPAPGAPAAYSGQVLVNPSRPQQQQPQHPYQQAPGLAPAPSHHDRPSSTPPYSNSLQGNYNTSSQYATYPQHQSNPDLSPWPAPLNYNKPLPASPTGGPGYHHPPVSELGNNYTTTSNGYVAELGGVGGRYPHAPHAGVQEMPTEYHSDWQAKENAAHRPAELA
ncbi:uncharacterized protein B0I36DRAFT_323281 [Microdochium trichocladiopsis]|uniref:DUF7053 domain-containing protein n=1 Tax=Microdochium trichocladiopsis TaxID=1682393 RepID=A0A9P9BQS2_9PEZI|nr:uncharacterized protein B0I36DRAFT_323281 [Microdochium trichocladiopsis]KAH7031145.1 hypothetical protein B0I36DRAFT_323281 [Microdochium trichocladiopsis]